MNHRPNPEENLERLIHATLQATPPRPAPRSLEQRVLQEIARRAALPWWRKSFAYWPLPARAALLLVLLGIVKLVLVASVWVMAGFDSAQFQAAFAQPVSWVESGLLVSRAFTGFFDIMLRNIPPLWLYGGVAVVVSLYVTLFGLGAAAYKALHAQR